MTSHAPRRATPRARHPRSAWRLALGALVASLVTGCLAPAVPEAQLAVSGRVNDFHTYELRRVGLLPVAGHDVSYKEASELTTALYSEFGSRTSFEWVLLRPEDLDEIPRSDPHRRGYYDPRSVLALARRFHLDALLVGTITDRRTFQPQRLAISLDLVAVETGTVVWSSAIDLDAGSARVREGVAQWSSGELGNEGSDDAEIILLSPRRFARFAAYQLAIML